MAYNLKHTLNKEERLSPGHRMCAGCGATIAVRNVLRGLHEEDEAVITCATAVSYTHLSNVWVAPV